MNGENEMSLVELAETILMVSWLRSSLELFVAARFIDLQERIEFFKKSLGERS